MQHCQIYATKHPVTQMTLLMYLIFFADAASVLGLTDPRLCYVLDGFLFIYAVVMTALFVKAKVSLTQHRCIWIWWCKIVELVGKWEWRGAIS